MEAMEHAGSTPAVSTNYRKDVLHMNKVLIGTNNKGKRDEFVKMINDRYHMEDIEFLCLSDLDIDIEVEEDRNSFVGNAIKKAREISDATGLPTIADDSGLEVKALNGAPGVYSARYSGGDDEDNNDKLLKEMEGVEDRSAQYKCVVAIAFPNTSISPIAEGVCEGIILEEREEGDYGFAYDSLFYVEEYGCSFSNIPTEEKNKISHRAKAFEEIMSVLALAMEQRGGEHTQLN